MNTKDGPMANFEEIFAEIPPRRKEVLLKLLAGESDEAIAESLGVHPGTVRNQISKLCQDFDLRENGSDRRSRRADLMALVAKYKPELMGLSVVNTEVITKESDQQEYIDNPFIPLNGVVEDSDLFFGRDQEINKIFELLNNGSSVALIGERAIGKSSILKAVCREVGNKLNIPRKPVEINLQNIDNDDDFYFALCESIGIEDNILKGYALTRELKKHRLVLILDEVEKMTWDGFTNNLRSQLRGLAEGKDAPLRLVIAASKPLNDLFPDSQDSSMTSPFIGLCIEENIGLWDEQAIRDFISHRLNSSILRPDIKVTFSKNEIVQIINESGGHPQKLMTLCYDIFNKYIQR